MTAVEITDEMVEAVAGHFYTMQSKIAWSQIDPHSSVALNYKRWATEALEAALPYLLPQPVALPRTGAELSAVSIQAHMAKRRQCPDYGIGGHDCSEHEVVTAEPTKQEYLAATRQYLDVPALSAFIAGVVADMLTPEQRARVIAYMREEEARVGVRS